MTYDQWKTTDPNDEYLGPEQSDEEKNEAYWNDYIARHYNEDEVES